MPDDKDGFEGGRVKFTGDEQSTCAVIIKEAKRNSDSGNWTCQVSTNDANGKSETSKNIFVITISSDPIKPRINVNDVDSSSKNVVKILPADLEGSNVSITPIFYPTKTESTTKDVLDGNNQTNQDLETETLETVKFTNLEMVGIIVFIVSLVIIIPFSFLIIGIVARSKGILCFTAKKSSYEVMAK